MPPVGRRWLYAGAALLLALSFIGLWRTASDVAHYPVELDGRIPAVLYEPGPQRSFGRAERDRKLPVLVLAHGFSGNKGMMSFLARALARAGYAVLTFDFQGHGKNPNHFGFSMSEGRSGLADDLDAALLWASTQSHLDQQRIAIAGHSMGGFAVLDYASRTPGTRAAVVISAGAVPGGPYTPQNVLLIWATGDPEGIRTGARDAGAHFAGLDRLVLERTYGEPERGTGVRLSEVGGTDHITILYSDEAAARIAGWLGATLGSGDPPVTGSDRTALWSLLSLISGLVLFAGLVELLAPRLPRVELPTVDRPLAALGLLLAALLGAVLLLAGVDGLASTGPLAFVPLVAGRDLLGFYAAGGLVLLVQMAARGQVPVTGLVDVRTWAGAGVLFAASYLVFGTLSQPWWDLWLPAHKAGSALLGTALTLPLFAAHEWLLRGPDRSGIWAPAVGRLILLAVIVAGALVGLLPFVLMLGAMAFALLFAIFEITCWRISRTAPNPWLAALYQAAFTGWITAAIFPSS